MVTIVRIDGTECSLSEWQSIYGLPVGGDKIGLYFSVNEPKFRENIKDYGKLVVNECLIRLLDKYRELKGSRVNINSFNRSDERQKRMVKNGERAAVVSPHVVKMASDVDTISRQDTMDQVALMKKAADILGYTIRIGYKEYLAIGKTFLHVDVCPMFFAPGKSFHKQSHPLVWERHTEW